MLHNVMKWLRHLFGSPLRDLKPATIALLGPSSSALNDELAILTDEHIETIAPYDENLLERAKTQWQFGDWQSLAAIDHDSLEHHPERAKLVLLAAAGRAQLGDMAIARQLIDVTKDWGCSKRLIAQILIAGVHNSLGHAAANIGQEARAFAHFKDSVAIGTPGNDVKLPVTARINQQIHRQKKPVHVVSGAHCEIQAILQQ